MNKDKLKQLIRESGFTYHIGRIIRNYKRLPITSMWITVKDGDELWRTNVRIS